MDVIHTTVQRNGQWVTEPRSLKDIMDGATKAPEKRLARSSPCGIMTRTVVESPVIHWILPVALRSAQHKDVAFIGTHYVQISELRQDGQLHSVIRKTDFGSRIRNAKVIGTYPDVQVERNMSSSHVRLEDDDDEMDMSDISSPKTASTTLHRLPPQLLLVVLETGDCAFLFVRPGQDGRAELVTTRHETLSKRLVRPGFHMAVDPSSRYVALACTKDLFVVYEIESMANLDNAYSHNQPLQPIISFRPRRINGVIHTMEFLYPRPEDPHHIVLLLIVVNGGKSRMVTYDWELGNDLKEVLAEEKPGHRLPPEHEMPMLIIPLKIRTAFLAISPDAAAFCKDVLQGDPQFETCDIENSEPSEMHDGLGRPLWTTWTRPQQSSVYQHIFDHIYLAREDGVVMYLEFNAESILESALHAGTFCNVSTAFASIYEGYYDVLIFGGDSVPGCIWKLPPRVPSVRLGGIPNWSPTIDFATTDEFCTWDQKIGAKGNSMVPWKQRKENIFRNPDRIFATAGRGVNGSIVEFRVGLQARIGLEFDCGTETVIRRSFLLPASGLEDGYHLVLSMPDTSALLYLPTTLAEAQVPDPEMMLYDLSSPTIMAVSVSEQVILQVTEAGIVFVGPQHSAKYYWWDVLGHLGMIATNASLRGDLLAVTTHRGTAYELHILKLIVQGMKAEAVESHPLSGEVTCLDITSIGKLTLAVAGLRDVDQADQASLSFHNVDSLQMATTAPLRNFKSVDDENLELLEAMEPLTSIVTVVEDSGKTVMVLGSRNGVVITLTFGSQVTECSLTLEKLGVGSAYVSPARDGSNSVFVCCDSGFFLLSDYQGGRKKYFTKKHNIWVTDEADSSKSVSRIDSVTVLQESLSGNDANIPLLLLTNNHILLADLQTQAGPVPRHIRVGGTPLKVVYSHHLECLVVAIKVGDKPTLKFIDPDTGVDYSFPSDKNGETRDFISGLGHPGDRIRALAEWQYTKDNDTWYFIIVCTDEGRLLVVSAIKIGGQIRYWTRHKVKKDDKQPIYCATGHDDGIVFCQGTRIYYDVIDNETKKLKSFKQYDVNSPVSSLRVINGMVAALTSRESIEIIDPRATGRSDQMALVHADPVTRPSMHMIEVAGAWSDADLLGWAMGADKQTSMMLLSDRACGIAGLSVPWKESGKDCEVMFEADLLTASVRRFRRGRTMPGWLQTKRRPQFGILPATIDGAEILGLGIDGSLQHFTLIKTEIWRLLRFVQNIAETSPAIYPFTYEIVEDDDDLEPKLDKGLEMQVDGDMLQRCLDQRALEGLIKARPAFLTRFVELLGELEGGKCVAGLEEEEAYFDLAYEILEYYLVPVL